jgi:phosphopantothenoylcysteine decarboxylase/phosphopantothenate--cysteine ligase
MRERSAVLGVGGGIAVYKSAELARALMERGFQVQTVMTDAAREFVQPLTFAALTGQKVITSLWGAGGADDVLASSVEHIQVAREHQVLVVAPATADLLAKFACGLATDFLSTLYLAFEGPVVLAPAMNTAMWNHPATRTNLETLRRRGHAVVDPAEGPLACGASGLGRLAEIDVIAGAVERAVNPRQDLAGEVVLVTAGPTQEPIDPVRFISNRSSGKMGYALAEAALTRGARVILISGPVNLRTPPGAELIGVHTAREMYDAVLGALPEASIVLKAAAVADFYVSRVPEQKVKKTALRMSLELDPTPDILAEVGRRKTDQLLIGFAAETADLVAEARRKLQAKNCDLLVANLVGHDGAGFEADDNEVVVVTSAGETVSLPRASKRVIADQVFDLALKHRLVLHAKR